MKVGSAQHGDNRMQANKMMRWRNGEVGSDQRRMYRDDESQRDYRSPSGHPPVISRLKGEIVSYQ